MRPRTFSLLAFAFFVPSLLSAAALSQKYKDWAASPQAYFMTKAEHEQWAAIKTDDETEQFVNRFLAGRAPASPTTWRNASPTPTSTSPSTRRRAHAPFAARS